MQPYLSLGTEILRGRPCHVKASFNTLLSCKATWRAGRVGSPGVAAVCGARLCRWADPTLSFTRRTNRSDMARPRANDVWRSCLIILCCSGRRLDFEVVVSLLASVSFVTVTAGLPSGACPETEYEFDYRNWPCLLNYFMVAQIPNFLNSFQFYSFFANKAIVTSWARHWTENYVLTLSLPRLT